MKVAIQQLCVVASLSLAANVFAAPPAKAPVANPQIDSCVKMREEVVACKEPFIDAMMALRAKLNPGFKKQYDESRLDRFWADVMNSGRSHPFPIWRVAEILEWVEKGEYEEFMASKLTRHEIKKSRTRSLAPGFFVWMPSVYGM